MLPPPIGANCRRCGGHSDHAYDAVTKKYIPVESYLNKMCLTSYTDLISMEGNTEEIVLKEKLNIKPALPASVGVITSVGVEFYQEVVGKPYILEMKCCMEIAEVF